MKGKDKVNLHPALLSHTYPLLLAKGKLSARKRAYGEDSQLVTAIHLGFRRKMGICFLVHSHNVKCGNQCIN